MAGTRTERDTLAFIESTLEQSRRNEGIQCAIRQDGRIAGVIGFHRCDRVRGSIELGYWLGAAYEGRGLMTRAVAALCDEAFAVMGLHRVEIRCAAHNERSRAVAHRLGFREEATLREAEAANGVWFDSVVYGMLAGEWRAQ